MADYIKLRMSAAKAGVTLALLALLGGLAERSRAESPPTASQSSLNFLKLTGISSAISGNLVKLEKKIVKIDTSLAKIERSLPQTYLKIKSANTDFLKIRSANASFLKIDDASAQYLKIEGTAQNANELGGLTSTQFVHGTGAIGTGAVTFAQGAFSEQTLLQFPGTNGAIIVVCVPTPGAGLSIVVRN